ncbi:FkbM family methyltransferase [Desulfovibrio sp. Huiquan2017]|uniref:FkbM family methyltransferase n=1 Tax=Desulfovibrio sp. Huiquan2017 TaxID=2816861 RepID=UPI001A92DAEB|nr:FkbM family methyltransferase [Desulfovibrio sp. Huiquan2017]
MTSPSHTRELIASASRTCLQFDWENAGLRPPDRLQNYFARLANRWLKKRGYGVQSREYIQTIQDELLPHLWAHSMLMATHERIVADPEGFDRTYALLEDEESRRTFDWYVRHRYAAPYLQGLADSVFPAPVTREKFMRVREENKDKAAATGLPVFNLTLLALGQYHLPECGACVREGDVVIDGGGECGDTAQIFRQRTGVNGKIYVFEPMDASRASIEQRCKASDWANVEVAPFGLWNETGGAEISESGSRLTALEDGDAEATQHIETITLDAFVQNNGLDRVDFIKMDIEGAEQNALLGCRETIERFSPRLAISIYHLADDMVRIPAILNEMRVDYKFYLRHYTYFFGDTVLYAVPRD